MQWENSLTIWVKHKNEIITKYRGNDHQMTNQSTSVSHGNTGQPPSQWSETGSQLARNPALPSLFWLTSIPGGATFSLGLDLGLALSPGSYENGMFPLRVFEVCKCPLWIIEAWVEETLWGCWLLALTLTKESTTQGTLQRLQIKHLCLSGVVLIIPWLIPFRKQQDNSLCDERGASGTWDITWPGVETPWSRLGFVLTYFVTLSTLTSLCTPQNCFELVNERPL